MFDRGPGGRRHGSGLPQQSDTAQRLHVKDAYRRKSKAERRAKPDMEDLGEPGYVRDDWEDPNALPPEFWQAADEYADAHLDAQNQLAKANGIGIEDWTMDRATFDEYHGDIRQAGLPGHVLAAEKKRLTDQLKGMDREDVDAIGAQQAWVDDLWMDWRDIHGADYEKAEVAEAAARVKARYEAEGSLNALRKIDRNKAEFLDDVWIELGSAAPAHLRRDHGGGRTAGLGNEYGTGHASGSAPERKGSTLSDELDADRRKSGYY